MATKKELREALNRANIAHSILQSKYEDVLRNYSDVLMELSAVKKENQKFKDVLNICDIQTISRTNPRVSFEPVLRYD